LLNEYRAKFDKWMLLLHEDFNLVTFGLGSKKRLLQDFHRQMLAKKDVIVVNGLFPSLTIKSVLDAITQGLLDRDTGFVTVQEQVAFILSIMNQTQQSEHIYLIVHNIDGPMLRSSMAQSIFSQLAAHPKIHLICSIDHINAPLIWDQRKTAKFNFVWFDTTTFLPYSEETVNASSFMVEQSGAPTLSSLNRVFESLNANARDIYLIVARFQVHALEDSEEASHYAGLMLSELYQKCREAFLVTSKAALKAQLTEFTDHKVISLKSTEGTEHVTIPLELVALAQFLEEKDKK
jgi:origin recognition complex subunit 2